MKLGVAVVLTSLALAGCPSEPATPQGKAQADLVRVAGAVKIADHLCADYATQKHDAATAAKCSKAYDVARSGLMLAESGVDAWGAPDAGQRLACGMQAASQALALTGTLVAIPADVSAALSTAAQWGALTVGSCVPASASDAGADAPGLVYPLTVQAVAADAAVEGG